MRNLCYSRRVCCVIPELCDGDLVLGGSEGFFLAFKWPRLYDVNPRQGVASERVVLPAEPSPLAGGLLNCLGEFTLVTQEGWAFQGTGPPSRLAPSADTASWSPDEELLALAAPDRLILLSSDLMVVSEEDLEAEVECEAERVALGWGREETQFKGSLGKGVTKAVEAAHPPASTKSTASWSPDGELLALSYFSPNHNKRRIKIFSREGLLQCVSEDIPGLNELICWRPSGSLMAAWQRLPNKNVICFIEKNGLKHGEFVLPDDLKVLSLSWSLDSTILCVHGERAGAESLFFWTTSNYHWYLKKVFPLQTSLVGVCWDLFEGESVVSGLCTDGLVFSLSIGRCVSRTPSVEGANAAFIGVIDGSRILLTSFQEGIVPPPMCGHTLNCPAPVLQVIFSPDILRSQYDLCTVLSDGSLLLFSLKDLDNLIGVRMEVGADPLSTWVWTRIDTLVVIDPFTRGSSLIKAFRIDDTLQPLGTVEVSFPVLAAIPHAGDLLVEGPDGTLHLISCEKASQVVTFSLPEVCLTLDSSPLGIFALSPTLKLYREGSLVASDVTSFLVRDPYILATTAQHRLLFLKVTGNTCVEVSSRRIERGSWLLSSFEDVALLQHPRGNLEVVRPRPLSLLRAAALLDQKLFADASSLLRRERIDLNLIVDHSPALFFDNVHTFIRQVPPQWLTLFITELSDTDVTRTLYANYYPQKVEGPGGKVNRVLEALREGLRGTDPSFLNPLLTTFAKMADYGEALRLATTKEAIQHLLLLAPVDTLYSAALKSYNLDAALRVASSSQMDPKEYIVYLNSLKDLPECELKAKVDLDLGDYASALRHLAECGPSRREEAIALVKKTSLFREGLDAYKDDPESYASIAGMLAESLFKGRSYQEAGVFFERAGLFDQAASSYTRSLDWRRALFASAKASHSEEARRALAKNLCDLLSAGQKHSEAGEVALNVLGDREEALEIYIKGKLWRQALYTAHSQESLDKVKEGVLDSLESFSKSIETTIQTMMDYAKRLVEARAEASKTKEFYDDACDTMSETSSTSSRSQSFTSRSSKSSKKASKKAWSLKKGSAREKEAITHAVSQLMQGIERIFDEFETLGEALLYFSEDEKVQELQVLVDRLLATIRQVERTVWPREEPWDEVAVMDHHLKYPPALKIPPKWRFDSLKTTSK